jgi:hypothetical protein
MAWTHRGRVHEFCLGGEHGPTLVCTPAFSFWGGSSSVSHLALFHSQNRALRRLFHAQLAVVPRLAGHFPIPRQWVVNPVGKNFFFHDCTGRLPGRVAPELSSQPHRQPPRRVAGQHGSADRAGDSLLDSASTQPTVRSAARNLLTGRMLFSTLCEFCGLSLRTLRLRFVD